MNGESEPSSESDRSASNQDLSAFLGSLRLLWRQSEPTNRGGWDVPKRTYRTRVDPTLGCWPLVLPWLMADPLLTGQQAMQRLEQEHPGLYLGSLRTLQRRMGEWRVTQPNRWSASRWGPSGTRKTASSTARSQCRPGVN